jgi:shikimate dehydrogenase
MTNSAVQPLLALLVYPASGNPLQYMVEQAIVRLDLDWRFLTFEVTPENLADAVRGLRALGFRGAQCASPHKQAIVPLLDRVTDTAAMVGSVNFIYREENALIGDNTQGRAVVQSIRASRDLAGKHVVLLGAGQIARATAIELATASVAGITIVNRTENHAAELAALLAEKFSTTATTVAWQEDYVVPPEADVLIHATSLAHGEENIPLPLTVDSLRPELLVVDATANTPCTWLLDEARRRDCATLDGLTICIEQVATAFHAWTGIDADRELLREAAEEFLGV